MVQTPRAVPLGELKAAVEATGLTCVQLPDPAAAIRGVVVHAPDDPAPADDLLVLCTAPSAGIPASSAIVVRAGALDAIAAELPAGAAVFAAPEQQRWSDLYDDVQWVVGESFGRLAERDVFHLADALATALGGAVAIEDAQRRVVAFSTVPGQPIDDVRREGILDRQVPEHVERGEWYARLWRTDGVVEYPSGPQSTARLAVAVRVGGEPVGSIWVVGSRAGLSPDADEVLLRAVDTVAACLAHQDHFATRSRELRRAVLAELFAAHDRQRSAGYALPGPSLLIGLSRAPAVGEPELLDERLADVLSLQSHRHRGSGLAGVVDGRVYALLPVTERGRLEATLLPVVSRILAAPAHICVSSPVDDVAELPAARRRVDRALQLWSEQSDGQDVTISYVDDDQHRLLLAEIAEAVRELDALRGGVVATIAAHDREHGSDYIATLRAWVESGGDVPGAAARLFVHANTFRYRMSRLQALFGVNLDVPDERLLLHLQLRLADFPDAAGTVGAGHSR
jgi:hypothetical protein